MQRTRYQVFEIKAKERVLGTLPKKRREWKRASYLKLVTQTDGIPACEERTWDV
jgi:hypothetical protein